MGFKDPKDFYDAVMKAREIAGEYEPEWKKIVDRFWDVMFDAAVLTARGSMELNDKDKLSYGELFLVVLETLNRFNSVIMDQSLGAHLFDEVVKRGGIVE